ncbi:hypothetical protein BC829DRAFT_32218 [Chytridium lagenaria]|nr:hypothetical protein BC829DRAFT_32218 [Chytridium lagenaria]
MVVDVYLYLYIPAFFTFFCCFGFMNYGVMALCVFITFILFTCFYETGMEFSHFSVYNSCLLSPFLIFFLVYLFCRSYGIVFPLLFLPYSFFFF